MSLLAVQQATWGTKRWVGFLAPHAGISGYSACTDHMWQYSNGRTAEIRTPQGKEVRTVAYFDRSVCVCVLLAGQQVGPGDMGLDGTLKTVERPGR